MEWEFDEMPVFRVNHTKDYTTLSNYHFREKNMSLKAKGLLSLMLSLPDNWDYSINGLVALSKDGINAVKAALSELKEFGYLTIDESRQQGKIGYTYNVYESPELKSKLTVAEKPSTVNRSLKTVDGKTVNDFTAAVNQRQLNTNISNTKELNTKVSNTENKYFDDPELNETFLSFMADRKERGKKMTSRAISMAVKKIQELSNGDVQLAIKIINQSIVNGWSGLFPYKAAALLPSQETQSKSLYELWTDAGRSNE